MQKLIYNAFENIKFISRYWHMVDNPQQELDKYAHIIDGLVEEGEKAGGINAEDVMRKSLAEGNEEFFNKWDDHVISELAKKANEGDNNE